MASIFVSLWTNRRGKKWELYSKTGHRSSGDQAIVLHRYSKSVIFNRRRYPIGKVFEIIVGVAHCHLDALWTCGPEQRLVVLAVADYEYALFGQPAIRSICSTPCCLSMPGATTWIHRGSGRLPCDIIGV